MAKRDQRLTLKQLRSSYLSSVISTSLVLFLLGVTGLFLLNAKRISDFYKENVGLSIYLKNNAKEAETAKFRKQLDASAFIRETRFISKEEAAKEMEKDYGKDFLSILSYNPLPELIEVKVQPDYANSDSITAIQARLEKDPLVKEVNYEKNLLDLVNYNIRQIGFIMLLFSGLLLFVSVVLISNTIRLSVYSKRFLINTMKLIGATKGFITRPFISRSLLQGFIAGALAVMMLCGLIYLLYAEFGDILSFVDANTLLLVFVAILALGMLITMVATYLSVRRYVQLGSDDLYY